MAGATMLSPNSPQTTTTTHAIASATGRPLRAAVRERVMPWRKSSPQGFGRSIGPVGGREVLPTIPIRPIGVDVHDVTFDEAVELVIKWAREGSGGYVSTPNVDHLVRARRDPEFRALMMGARLRVPDGMGLIYGSRLGGTPVKAPVHGRLLPEAIVRRTADDPLRIAMIGGRDDAPERATEYLNSKGGK